MAEFLIENSHPGSAVVYSRDYADGNTPLHLVASQGMRALPLAELLIDKGGLCLLESTTIDGSTPLHKAFLVYSATMVELFFRKSKILAKTGSSSGTTTTSNNDPCKGVKKRLLSMMLLHEGPVQCPVCLEDFGDTNKDQIVVLNCGHVLCTADHARLIRQVDSPKCPECRKEI
jgi:ankyrin repeat protein